MEVENGGEFKIGDTFTIAMNKKIGSGAFGEIFRGLNTITKEEVAIKMVFKNVLKLIKEPSKSRTPQLLYESKILKYLQGGGILNSLITRRNTMLLLLYSFW